MKKTLEIITVDGCRIAVDREPIANIGEYVLFHSTWGKEFEPKMLRKVESYHQKSPQHEKCYMMQDMNGKITGSAGYSDCAKIIAHSGHPSLADSGLPLLTPIHYQVCKFTHEEGKCNTTCPKCASELPPVEHDAEQLADEDWNNDSENDVPRREHISIFTRGYTAAQPKQFTIEDIENAIDEAWSAAREQEIRSYCGWVEKYDQVTDWKKDYLQSLQSVPKYFEAEMEKQWLVDLKWVNSTGIDWNNDEDAKADDIAYAHRYQYKTVTKDNNTYLVGRYAW
jgi:hypothetical protein